jgi:hypothetical protein
LSKIHNSFLIHTSQMSVLNGHGCLEVTILGSKGRTFWSLQEFPLGRTVLESVEILRSKPELCK